MCKISSCASCLACLLRSYGFEFVTEQLRECCYTRDAHAMVSTVYRCAFFSAVKPGGAAAAPPPKDGESDAACKSMEAAMTLPEAA